MTTTIQDKREKARQELYNLSLTRNGAMEIANYFINTVSWNKLLEAYNELKK